MLLEKDFTYFLNQRILKGIQIEPPGSIYGALCNAFPLLKIRNSKQHQAAIQILTQLSEYLTAQTRDRKFKNQVLQYLDTLGVLIEEYEKSNFSRESEKISGAEVLEFLMEQHNLKQSDLAKELGSQSIVSEILSGKRKLNNNQIAALSKRFGVSPAVFFPV